MGDRWVINITHFPEPGDPVHVPEPARRLGTYFGSIVSAASSCPDLGEIQTGLRCRRRPGRRPCRGHLRVHRIDLPPEIYWHCPVCSDQGVISSWQGTFWDFTKEWKSAQEGRHLKVAISMEEYEALRLIPMLDREAERVVFSARYKVPWVTLSGSEDDFDNLLGYVAAEANHTSSRKRQYILDRIGDCFENTLRESGELLRGYESYSSVVGEPSAYDDQGNDPDRTGRGEAQFRDAAKSLSPGLDAMFQETLTRDGFHSTVELDRALQGLVDRYNREPQVELGGLSPNQMGRLLAADWVDPAGALRVNESLSLEDLKNSRLFFNARRFLGAVNAAGAVKATATGNLTRKFVEEMLETMRWAAGFVEFLRKYNKVINEMDVFRLHCLRVLLDLSGLLRRTRGNFRLTRRGVSLLDREKGGILYARLFRTFFRKFNLAYLDRLPSNPEFQDTVGLSLLMLSRWGKEWITPEELAPKLVLPLAQPQENRLGDNDLEEQVISRVLMPLEEFGLLERDKAQEPDILFYGKLKAVRKTPLFDRFLTFDI